MLLTFTNEVIGGGRVSPYGLDVERSGRISITDIENHRILVYDAYLSLELVFGSYGSYEGQLDTPTGVSFDTDGNLLVTDSGNRRIMIFDDTGAYLRTIPAEGAENPLLQPRRAVMDDNGMIFEISKGEAVISPFTSLKP